MQFGPNGTMVFGDINELYYDLFMELGLAIKNQYLYIQDGDFLKFGEKFIKTSIDGTPVYPGKNDIIFDPSTNYTLISMIFGYYLDRSQDTEDGDILQGYIAHFIDDNPERDKQRVIVRTKGRGDICSKFYYNIYLAYIDCIFTIAGYNVDLSNFDIKPLIVIGGKKK